MSTSVVGAWHRDKYPDATSVEVALKFAEESGELVRALNAECDRFARSGRSGGSVYDELGDVLIVAEVIAARHGWNTGHVLADRFSEVSRR